MHYSLVCTVPKNLEIEKVADLISKDLIKHDSMLRGVYKAIVQDLQKFIQENDFTIEQIEAEIKKYSDIPKKDILRNIKTSMPYADSKIVMEILNQVEDVKVVETVAKQKNWLEEGEVSKLTMPEENKQATEQILKII